MESAVMYVEKDMISRPRHKATTTATTEKKVKTAFQCVRHFFVQLPAPTNLTESIVIYECFVYRRDLQDHEMLNS